MLTQVFVIAMTFTVAIAAAPNPANTTPLQSAPKTLDEQLKRALDTNPEVNMARAKVQQAEASYREVRLRVTQEVMQAHNDRDSQMLLIDQSARELDRTKSLAAKGLVGEDEVFVAESQFINQKQQLAQLEARMNYLLGIDPLELAAFSTDLEQKTMPTKVARIGRPPVPQRFEPLLNKKVHANFKSTPLNEVVQFLNQELHGLDDSFTIVINELVLSEYWAPSNEISIDLQLLKPMAIRELLTAIGDLVPVCFVIRDYGILVTLEDHAMSMYAPTIPSDVKLDPGVVPSGAR